jgi:hypothetical protein
MMQEIKMYRILKGPGREAVRHRRNKRGNPQAVAAGMRLPEIVEMDINPLLVKG